MAPIRCAHLLHHQNHSTTETVDALPSLQKRRRIQLHIAGSSGSSPQLLQHHRFYWFFLACFNLLKHVLRCFKHFKPRISTCLQTWPLQHMSVHMSVFHSIPCSLPTNIHSLQQHLKRCCPRACSLAIQHHDLRPQGGRIFCHAKYPPWRIAAEENPFTLSDHYLTISDLLCICYQYHLIYTVIYCWYLHQKAPCLQDRIHSSQVLSDVGLIASQVRAQMRHLQPLVAVHLSKTTSNPFQEKISRLPEINGFQMFPMSFEVLLAHNHHFSSLVYIFWCSFSWFFMVFHHFSVGVFMMTLRAINRETASPCPSGGAPGAAPRPSGHQGPGHKCDSPKSPWDLGLWAETIRNVPKKKADHGSFRNYIYGKAECLRVFSP